MDGSDTETQLGLVSAGIGVSIQPASYALLARQGLVWLRLPDDAPRSPLQMAWPVGEPNPATATFCEIATAIARRHGPVLRVGPYA
jgi:DNA-binding transcriptional LysR family regulator